MFTSGNLLLPRYIWLFPFFDYSRLGNHQLLLVCWWQLESAHIFLRLVIAPQSLILFPAHSDILKQSAIVQRHAKRWSRRASIFLYFWILLWKMILYLYLGVVAPPLETYNTLFRRDSTGCWASVGSSCLANMILSLWHIYMYITHAEFTLALQHII